MKTTISNVTFDIVLNCYYVMHLNNTRIYTYSAKSIPETVKKFIESAEKRIDNDYIRYERAYNENDYL